jgi:hypothetical protein
LSTASRRVPTPSRPYVDGDTLASVYWRSTLSTTGTTRRKNRTMHITCFLLRTDTSSSPFGYRAFCGGNRFPGRPNFGDAGIAAAGGSRARCKRAGDDSKE